MPKISVGPNMGLFGAVGKFLRLPKKSRGGATATNVRIGRVRPEDGAGLLRVHLASFRDTYSRVPGVDQKALADFIENDLAVRKKPEWEKRARDGGLFVARSGQEVVGFCEVTRNGSGATVNALYILPGHQSRGLGRQLLERALKDLPRPVTVDLYVAQYTPAVRFYKKFGFKEHGEPLLAEPPFEFENSHMIFPLTGMKLEIP